MLSVEYVGWLENGKPFDSSFRRDDAYQFADESPDPDPSELVTDVYADPARASGSGQGNG